ncbi:MAG: hypothetical protein JNM58_01675 [Xanthomonadaceae bacterium]|nr:hypothetical protein [Xanthomonadaceae bacterium]
MSCSKYIAVVLSVLLPMSAHAADRVFEFTGKVIHGGTLAPEGAEVAGSFSYDPSTRPWFEIGTDAHYLIPAPHYIEVRVAGQQALGTNLVAYVSNDFGGNVEDVVSIDNSGGLTLDGAYLPEGTLSVVFASGPGSTGALHNRRLPRKYDLVRFDAPGGSGGILRRNGEQDGTLLQFSIETIVARRICPAANDRAETSQCVER